MITFGKRKKKTIENFIHISKFVIKKYVKQVFMYLKVKTTSFTGLITTKIGVVVFTSEKSTCELVLFCRVFKMAYM